MKIISITIIILLLSTSVLAVETVQVLPKPPQKILYDDDKTLNDKEYFGWAAPNTATSASSWKIMRITYSGNDFTIEWADGNMLYDNEYDERANLTYK